MKKKQDHYPHFEIFLKFLISYLLITVVFMIPLLMLYHAAWRNTKEGIIKDSYANMQKGYLTIEKEILHLNKLAVQLRNDSDFQKIARQNGDIPSDQVYHLVRAYNKMRDSGFSSDLIFDSYMIFRRNNTAISRSRIITDTDNLEDYFISNEKQAKNIFGNKSQITFEKNMSLKYRSSIFLPYEERQIIQCILSLPVDNPRTYDSAMLVQLDTEHILQMLASEDILQHGFLYIANNRNEIIYQYHYDGDVLNLPAGISEGRWLGEDANLLNLTQSDLGLRIVAGIPNSAYMAKISNMTQILVIYIVVAVFLGIALALFFAYRKSRLMNGIIDTIRTFTQPISNSSKNEYDYIRNSLIQFDRSNQAYKQQLAAVQEDIKMYLVQKLLNGQPCSEREKKNFIHFYDIQNSFFVVLVLSSADMDLNSMDPVSESIDSAESFHLVLQDAIRGSIEQNSVFCNLSTNSCAVILNLSEKEAFDIKRLNPRFALLREKVFHSTGSMINIGISDACNDLEEISKCFWQARQALIQREEDPMEGISHYQGNRRRGAENIYDPSMALKLNERILMGEKDSVNHLFVMIWQRLIRYPVSDAQENRQIMLSIRNTLSHAAGLLGKEEEAFDDISAFRDQDTPEDSLRALHRSALRLAKRAEKMKSDRVVHLGDSVVRHLRQNYSDSNLCAAQVAVKFNLSEKYVFHIVKVRTGKSFGEYLEGIRFGESERLLADSGLSISMIAERVGFNSANTFHKAFKRVYGITPGAWRNQCSKMNPSAEIIQGPESLNLDKER
mgnify:CR=1 FL=1